MDEIIAKIQKLLALTDSANEHEATLAMEKANELLVKHNLSLLTVNGHGQKEATGHMTAETKHSSPWVRHLWHGVARLNFCEYFYSASNHLTEHTVIGSAANSTSACHMAEYLTQTVLRLSKEAQREHNADNKFRESFKKGCGARVTSRLWEKLREQKEGKMKMDGVDTSNLPMVIDQNDALLKAYVEETFGKLRATKSRARASNSFGYSLGREAGNRVSLNNQIGGNAATARIGNGS